MACQLMNNPWSKSISLPGLVCRDIPHGSSSSSSKSISLPCLVRRNLPDCDGLLDAVLVVLSHALDVKFGGPGVLLVDDDGVVPLLGHRGQAFPPINSLLLKLLAQSELH